LAKPRTIVLTSETAQKYFGNEDPVGKMIKVNNDTTYFTITGIIEEVEAKMQSVLEKNIGPQLEQVLGITIEEFTAAGNRYGLYLQPIEDIHLNLHIQHGLKPSNDKKYIYIFALIAFFIILLAAIR
jgi:putative ABC transport system permease protein